MALNKEGLSKIKAAQEDRRRKAAASGGGGNFFRVKEDEQEQFRLLETLDEIDSSTSAFFHELEALKKNQPPRLEICLDQDDLGNPIGAECPGCDLNAEDWEVAKRKLVLYANVIWRDAPVRKKNDKSNKYEETGEKKDTLAVWEIRQSTIQDTLVELSLTYKDLTTRDFTIRRRGTGFDTTYTIQPAVNEDGDAVKTPLSDEDKELGEKKPDLTARVAKVKQEDWGKVRSKGKDKDEEGDGKPRSNPFLKRGESEPEPEAENE